MSDVFDPYYTWLSIPPEEQPPNHYRLLGVTVLESNPDVIASAADRQMAHVRSFQSGKHSAESQKLLNELSAARVCLLAGDQKHLYDQSLKVQLARSAPPQPPRTAAAQRPPGTVPPNPGKPVRIARPIATQAQPTARPGAEVPLGFDPLAESTSPRRRRRKQSGGQSFALAGIGLGLLAAAGLAWAIFGGGDAPTDSLPASSTASRSTQGDRGHDHGESASKPGDEDLQDKSGGTHSSTNDRDASRHADLSTGLSAIAGNEADIDPADGPAEADSASENGDSARAVSGQWRFAGGMPWCGEIGPHPGAIDEPQVLAELSPDGRHGRIFGKSARPEDTIELSGRTCGWFGKALVWETTIKDLSRTIKLSYGAPWITERVEYSLAICSIDEPTRLLLRHEMRAGTVEIQRIPASGGKSKVGFLIDGYGQPGAFVAIDSQPVRVALYAVLRYGGFDCDLRCELSEPGKMPASSPPKPGDNARQFLSALLPDEAQVYGNNLLWGRIMLEGVLSDHGICMVPPTSNSSAHAAYQLPPGFTALQGRVGISDALPVVCPGAMTAVTFRIVGDGRKLWSSQPLQRRGVAEDFSVSIRKVKTLELFVDCPGAHNDAWAVWFDPCLTTSPTNTPVQPGPAPHSTPDGEDIFLSSLPAQDLRVWSGSSLYWQPTWLGGLPSPHGLFMVPEPTNQSHVMFQLPAGYREFVGKVGIEDPLPVPTAHSAVTFRALGDGRELWKSRPLAARGESQPFAIDVTGVRDLELLVDCPGSNAYCHAVWFEPRLTTGSQAKSKRAK